LKRRRWRKRMPNGMVVNLDNCVLLERDEMSEQEGGEICAPLLPSPLLMSMFQGQGQSMY
jgi:hypothetical protein